MNKNNFEILPCQQVTFVGCFYLTGRTQKGEEWYALDFKFSRAGKTHVERKFQPRPGNIKERELYAQQLMEILNTLSGKKLWETISRAEVGRSWSIFYTKYISLINQYKNKSCYIKTLPREKFKDGKIEIVPTLAEKNFISMKPDLEYTVLEQSAVDRIKDEVPDLFAEGDLILPS